MKPRHFALCVLLAALSPAVRVSAQENGELGRMWTFENPPLEYLQAMYGFSPSQAWLDHARLASIRFGNGCSSSFVSPRGLILTNHHCVRDYVANVSPKDQDWVKDGYFATSLATEVKVPGLTVQQLVSTTDVTARMNAGIAAGDPDEVVNRKRTQNEAAIMKAAAEETPNLKPQVVRLFQGAVFQLYRYKVFSDIRLAAAPNLQTAHFGGDPDNFTYPRFGIDFALMRAWEDGKPADTSAHYFRWSDGGPKDTELVFVTGNPGRTDRAKTYAQFEAMRDVLLPTQLATIDGRIEVLQAYAAKGAAEEKATRTEILGLQNSQKAIRGMHGGLLDPRLMAQKKQAEEAFRSKVQADAKLRELYGDAWDKLAAVADARRGLEPRVRFHSFQGFKLLQRAFHLVRITDPKTSEQARQANTEQLAALDMTESPYDVAAYARQIENAVKWLPKDDPFLVALLRGKAPLDAIRSLREETTLGDREVVDQLLKGGPEAVAKSTDPLLAVAKVLAPLVVAAQGARLKLDAEEAVHGVRVGQALFAVYGHKIAPDATFTLRIADGVVKGYPCNGTLAPWRTSFYGLYARNVEFDNQYPFDLPPIWLARKDQVDLSKSVNFVSTNDIIGGNSGSPIVNKDLQIVGLVFDGNIESLPNRFVFREDVPRTVSVHSDAILESLNKVYDRPALADELRGKGGYQ